MSKRALALSIKCESEFRAPQVGDSSSGRNASVQAQHFPLYSVLVQYTLGCY
jgi:hypothetical protein